MADALPELAHAPDLADAHALVKPPDALAAPADLALPHSADPPPQAILQLLALHGPRPRRQRRGHVADAGRTLGRQHAALDEQLCRRARGQAARQADRRERAGELAGHDGGAGHEDVAGDEVRQRGPHGRGEQRRQRGADVAAAEGVQDGRHTEAAEMVRCLDGGESRTGERSEKNVSVSWLSLSSSLPKRTTSAGMKLEDDTGGHLPWTSRAGR